MASRIPPPLPGNPVPKDYVRQQLNLLGIRNVTEEDIEAYAADLTQLIKDTLGCKDGTENAPRPSNMTENQYSENEQFTTCPDHHYEPHSNSTPSRLHHSSPESLHEAVSAVFKTFPGDKENKIHYLSPSPSPSPLRTSAYTKEKAHYSGSHGEHQPSSAIRSPESPGQKKGRYLKRKVLRKHNGKSKVFDESTSEVESDVEKPLAHYLSDLSLTSVTSTHSSCQPARAVKQPSCCCKSYIRPSFPRPPKKTDPVKRYQYFQKIWENWKPPGDDPRNLLRWNIREQLMHQDIPYFEPQRRSYKPNQYVVPTMKRRNSLRWEVRHALAHN